MSESATNRRGQKDWTHNISYELAREYNTMVLMRNKQRSGINRRPKREIAFNDH